MVSLRLEEIVHKYRSVACLMSCAFDFPHVCLLQAFAHLVLIAGGTGITPMLQLASATLHHHANQSHVTLLSFSKSNQDICLYRDLVNLHSRCSASFTLKFFASKLHSGEANEGVIEGSIRAFTATQLLDYAGAPISESTMFCVCGPLEWTISTQRLLQQGGVSANHILTWT
jgi:ferredoxin-NADP reductase